MNHFRFTYTNSFDYTLKDTKRVNIRPLSQVPIFLQVVKRHAARNYGWQHHVSPVHQLLQCRNAKLVNLYELLKVAGMWIRVRLQQSHQQIELKYYDVLPIAIAIVKTNYFTSSSLFHGSTIDNVRHKVLCINIPIANT